MMGLVVKLDWKTFYKRVRRDSPDFRLRRGDHIHIPGHGSYYIAYNAYPAFDESPVCVPVGLGSEYLARVVGCAFKLRLWTRVARWLCLQWLFVLGVLTIGDRGNFVFRRSKICAWADMMGVSDNEARRMIAHSRCKWLRRVLSWSHIREMCAYDW